MRYLFTFVCAGVCLCSHGFYALCFCCAFSETHVCTLVHVPGRSVQPIRLQAGDASAFLQTSSEAPSAKNFSREAFGRSALVTSQLFWNCDNVARISWIFIAMLLNACAVTETCVNKGDHVLDFDLLVVACRFAATAGFTWPPWSLLKGCHIGDLLLHERVSRPTQYHTAAFDARCKQHVLAKCLLNLPMLGPSCGNNTTLHQHVLALFD